MPELRAISAFTDNYIWTLSSADGRAVVVDPGDAGPVFAAIDRGLRPVAILLTHHHPDHIGGAATLLERHPVPCYAPHDPRIGCATHRVGESDAITVADLGLQFDTLEVHGHTRSHVAFHGGGIVFCGDTLFSLGCGRLFEGTPAQMLESLDKLAALPPDTLVCCGHEYTLANGAFALHVEPGNVALHERVREVRALREAGQPSVPGTIASELDCNPFLRVDAPTVRAAAEGHLGHACSDRVAVFAALRARKDGFSA